MKKWILFSFAALFMGTAVAGGKHHQPESAAVGVGTGISGAEATAASVGVGISGAEATTTVDVKSVNNQTQRANADSAVNFSNDSTAFAIGLSPATASPIDPSICAYKHTRGFDARVFAMSGNTKRDAKCLGTLLDEQVRAAAHARCLELFQAYLQLGLRETAARQLESCGGVERAVALSEVRRTSDFVTHEHLDRVVTSLLEK